MSASALLLWLRHSLGMADQAQLVRGPRCCGHISFTDGNNLFVWGGHHQSGFDTVYSPRNEIWIFRDKFRSWTMQKCTGTLPPCLASPCSAVVFPYLYLFCGFEERYGHVNKMWRLNLNNFNWERICVDEPSISPRDKFSSWMYRNSLYCFGGYGEDPSYSGLYERGTSHFVLDEGSSFGWNNQLLAFDPSVNKWSIPKCKGTRPLPRAAHASVLMVDKVYLFGGRHLDHRMNDLHCLDLATMTWEGEISVCGPVPDGRSWHSLSVIDDDRIFLYGGYSQTQDVFDDAWIYSVSQQTWTKVVEHTGQPRGWHTAVVTNNKDILIYGGFTRDIHMDFFENEAFSDLVLKFQFQPYSLKLQCLDLEYIYNQPDTWDQLPKNLLEWLKTKQSLQASWRLLPQNKCSSMGPFVVSGWQGQASTSSSVSDSGDMQS